MKVIEIKDVCNIFSPDMVFVFSDAKIRIQQSRNALAAQLKTVSETSPITERREFHDEYCIFDIAPFIQYKFNIDNINRVDGPISRNYARGIIELEIITEEADGTTKSGIFTLPYVWGAFGLTDSYTKHRLLVWNPNYPFTVDLDAVAQYKAKDGNNYTDVQVSCNGVIESVPVQIVSQQHTRYDIFNFVKEIPQNVHLFIMGSYDYNYGTLTKQFHTIDIDIDTSTKGIYLRWLDHLGRLCYRLFKKSAESIQTKSDNNYTREYNITQQFTEYENEYYNSGSETYQSISAINRLSLGIGNNSEEQMRELLTLVVSPCVDMYIGDYNMPMWQRVVVVPGTYSLSTRKLQDFIIQIDVPIVKAQLL